MVTISAETGNLSCSLEELTHQIADIKGTVKVEAVAG